MSVEVRLIGLDEAIADLEAEIDEALEQGMLRAAQAVAEEAYTGHTFNNRTGMLEARLQAGAIRGRASDGEILAEVVGDTEYGEFVEAKLPYLAPAAERAEERMEDEIDAALERAAERAGWTR